MPVHLLIDTNIFKRIVSKIEFSTNLLQLEFLVKQNHVILLSPEILKTEWVKHKEEERDNILKSLKDLELEIKKKDFFRIHQQNSTRRN
jgi:DNA-binding LytR/AlgR family response regulator